MITTQTVNKTLRTRALGLAVIGLIAALTFTATDADAKRLGGGKSVGKQAPASTLQREAAPSAPAGAANAAPAMPATPAAKPAAPAAAPAAAAATGAAAKSGASRWLGPIAGIAAGLGLAALASHFGFGDALASFMLIALVAVAAGLALRWFLARRASGAQPAYAGAYRDTGLGQEASVPSWQPPIARMPTGSTASVGSAPLAAPAAAASASAVPLPAGFDADGFVRNARVYFVRLQAAYDSADLADLREFTTPELAAEFERDLAARGDQPNRTEVQHLDAALLGVELGESEAMATVRFSGLLREGVNAGAQPFDEVWNFTRPVNGQGGWVLAGIQQLEGA